MAIHVYHHDGDGCGSICGGFLLLGLIGWLIYVVPGWVWLVLLVVFIIGACSKK